MISRYDFIKDIDSDNPTHDFTKHYREICALYNMIGGRSDIDVVCFHNPNDAFCFNLLLENEKSALELRQRCNTFRTHVYGEKYRMKAKLRNNTVYLKVLKAD